MSLKTLAIVTALSAVVGFSALAAKPEPANAQNLPTLAKMNCSALNQGTLLCVRNATAETITRISCSGFWGTSDLSIPEGVIESGETTIVDFTKGKCTKQIDVRLESGRIIQFLGFDTTNNTVLRVNPKQQ